MNNPALIVYGTVRKNKQTEIRIEKKIHNGHEYYDIREYDIDREIHQRTQRGVSCNTSVFRDLRKVISWIDPAKPEPKDQAVIGIVEKKTDRCIVVTRNVFEGVDLIGFRIKLPTNAAAALCLTFVFIVILPSFRQNVTGLSNRSRT